MKKTLWLLIIAVVAMTSCKKDDPEEEMPPVADIDYRSGALVSNEGSFGSSNASVSWISGSTVENDLFNAANDIPLGDVLQSVAIHNDKAYAVVNNSAKVEVVDLKNFMSVATITGCDYPRHFIGINDSKGYISNGSGAGQVMIVDLNTNQITGNVAVGNGPEKMVYNGTYVFVANSGGWGLDNTVSVIDPMTDTVVETISVGDVPMDLVVTANNDVLVMAKGYTEYDENWNIVNETASELSVINGQSLMNSGTIQVGTIGDHVDQLAISPSGNTAYLELNGVWTFNVTTGELSGNELIAEDFRSVDVNPNNGDIYVTTVPDYVNTDEVKVYSSAGDLIRTLGVGIAPNGVTFYE